MPRADYHYLTVHLAIFILSISPFLLIKQVSADKWTDRSLVNADFEISSTKASHQVDIICKTLSQDAWSNVPNGSLNLSNVRITTIRDCGFPAGLSLLQVVKNLGVDTNDTLKIENSRTKLRKEHLSGFQLRSLYVYDGNFFDNEEEEAEGVASDLLSEIDAEELLIEKVPLKAIPRHLFSNSSKLRYVHITNSGLQRIRRDDFASLVNLRNLFLFNNAIEDIEANSFDDLVSVKVFDISRNQLKSLPDGLFRKLVRLEKLHLSQNQFDHLPDNLLSIDNSRLKRVRLIRNRGSLRALPTAFFRNLSSLNYVDLTGNNFTSIPADVFSGANSLAVLNISHNSLLFLPPKLFEGTSLAILEAVDNKLESLPESLFEDISLERLFMNGNRLTNLSLSVLAGLTTLKILQLSNNNLNYIEPNVCKYLREVEYIDLSHNELTLVNPLMENFSVLLNCVKLISLNLSYNKITRFFEDWKIDSGLKNLNLEGNYITQVTSANLDVPYFDVELNLRNNQISTIDFEGLLDIVEKYERHNPTIKRNFHLNLDDNPLNCDCNSLEFFRFLEKQKKNQTYDFIVHASNLRCAEPAELHDTFISQTRGSDLRCLTTSNETSDVCSKNCTCWRIPGRQVLSVDCSYRQLTSVPSTINIPSNWTLELNMSGNHLHSTPKMNTSYLINVTALDLSFNNLSVVTVDVFTENLQDLKLHNNSISRIDYYVVQHLYDDDYLKNLTLHGNPWICDCETRNMHNFVQKKLQVFNLYEITCRENNVRLFEVTSNELCQYKVMLLLAAVLILASCVAAVGFVAAFYFKYKIKIKIWLYSKQWCLCLVTEEELDKDKLYDCFISFSHQDEDFVRDMVATLESGPVPYKVCVHYRDWIPGEWIPNNIIRSVQESRRTIIIMSSHFLESMWGLEEFKSAYNQSLSDGRTRVIVVLLGDLGNLDAIDPNIKTYLSMNTYVKWGDPWFWEKLRFVLPHKPDGAKRSRGRRSRNVRIIENHLSQLPVNNHHNDKAEVIPMPKITAQSDSTKLLESNADEERHLDVWSNSLIIQNTIECVPP